MVRVVVKGNAGSGVVFVGVFLPILRVPIVGNINYFSNGHGDGAIVLALAVASVVLALKRLFAWIAVAALPSLALLVATFVRVRTLIAEMHTSLESQLSDNPFKGLAEHSPAQCN